MDLEKVPLKVTLMTPKHTEDYKLALYYANSKTIINRVKTWYNKT